MAENPYVNKVVFGNTTLLDISDTTAIDTDVLDGKVFYGADGAQIVGTFQPKQPIIIAVITSSSNQFVPAIRHSNKTGTKIKMTQIALTKTSSGGYVGVYAYACKFVTGTWYIYKSTDSSSAQLGYTSVTETTGWKTVSYSY